MKVLRDFIVEVICSPKRITYFAEDQEDAKALFLEENPAFEENDIDCVEFAHKTGDSK